MWQIVAITPAGRISSQPATFDAKVPGIVAAYESDDLPATLPTHTQGTVKVKITNVGDALLAAPFRISVFASDNGSLDTDYLLNGGSAVENQPLGIGDSLELNIPVAFDFKGDPYGGPISLLVVVDRAAGGRHGSHRQYFAVALGPSLPVE
jgi:hemolysin activation/secretion protein